VPGFDSPNAARFCAKLVYVSAKATESALFVKKPRGESFSNAIAEDMVYTKGRQILGIYSTLYREWYKGRKSVGGDGCWCL